MVELSSIYDIVKQKTFQDLHNYGTITLRNNVRLTILNNGKSVRGMIYSNVIASLLPNSESYWFVYSCENQYLSNLISQFKDWTNLETILNTKKVNIDIVTTNNRLIPNRMVYVRNTTSGSIIAIDNRVFQKYGDDSVANLIIHTDTDSVNERKMVSHIPGVHSNISEVLSTFQQYEHYKTLGFINGYCYRHDMFPITGNANEDYYELYIDENVVFSFTQSLSQRSTYWSSEENLYKDIIIIPRDLLQDEVHTYDTFIIVIMSKDGKGIYLPFLADKSVSTLTHGAIGISSYLIDAAYDKLGISEGDIYIQVSKYTKDNHLLANGKVTEELYLHDDDKVKDALMNSLQPQVPFWSGNEMEKSEYAKILTHIDHHSEFNYENMRKLIRAWGFYPFTLMLCKHSEEIRNLNNQIIQLNLSVPIFWQDQDIFPILYLNGIKIRHDRYTTERVNSTVIVTFPVPLPIEFTWSYIQYEWILNIRKRSRSITVTDSNKIFLVPKESSSIKIFKKETPVIINKVEGVLTEGYKEIDINNNPWFVYSQDNNNHIFNFNELAYSNIFITTSDDQVAFFNRPNVDLDLAETLAYIPTTRTITDDEEIPSLTENSYDIFLNGRYLVPTIDWCLQKLINTDGVSGGYQVVVQNLSLLKDDSSDSVEIYQTSRVVLKREVGYVIGGIIPITTTNEAWFQGISRLFINGKLVPSHKIIRHQTHYEIDESCWSNGNTYCFEISVSKDFYQVFQNYLDQDYFNGREQITNHFTFGWERILPEPIVITFPHRIYSSYLNEIIKRVNEGSIEVHFINDDIDILRQVRAYDYLKEFDIFFREDSNIDLDYSDVFPGYIATLQVSDFNKYLFLKRLVKILIGTDPSSDSRIVYTSA